MRPTTNPRINLLFLVCNTYTEIQRVDEPALGSFASRERQAGHEHGRSWDQVSVSVTLSQVHTSLTIQEKHWGMKSTVDTLWGQI